MIGPAALTEPMRPNGCGKLPRISPRIEHAGLSCAQRPDIRQPRQPRFRDPELEGWESCVRPCSSDRLRERSYRLLGAAIDDREVEVSRIAVLTDVDEPKRGPALEDETAAMRHLNLR